MNKARFYFLDKFGTKGREFVLNWAQSQWLFEKPELMDHFLSGADESILKQIETIAREERQQSAAQHYPTKHIPDIEARIERRRAQLRPQLCVRSFLQLIH